MKNILVFGSKTVEGTSLNYETASNPNYLTTCQFENNGSWGNPPTINEAGLLTKTENHELEMLCQIGFDGEGSHRTEVPSGKNCLFFKAPVAGRFKIVTKPHYTTPQNPENRPTKKLLVFIPFQADCLSINFQNAIMPQGVMVGNSIVIGLNDPNFNQDRVREIVKKALFDYIWGEISNRNPNAGPILKTLNQVGNRWEESKIFSVAELRRVKGAANSTTTARRTRAWQLCNEKVTDALIERYSFPLKANDTLPLYDIEGDGNDFRRTLKLNLGFCEIPNNDSDLIFNDDDTLAFDAGWTWFDPVRMIRRLQFQPQWNIGGIPEEDAPMLAWHAHPSAVLINKLSNQGWTVINPKQDREETRIAHRIPFFLANRAFNVNLVASTASTWQYRNRAETGSANHPLPGFEPQPAINNSTTFQHVGEGNNLQKDRFLQIKATTNAANSSNLVLASVREADRFDNFIELFGPQNAENRFANTLDIDTWFRAKTHRRYTGYLDWFTHSVVNTLIDEQEHFGRARFTRSAQANFNLVWNQIPSILSPNRSNDTKANIFHIFSIMAIIANESTGIKGKTEEKNTFSTCDYFQRFSEDANRTKQSYNIPVRPTADFACIPAGFLFLGPSDNLHPDLRIRYQRQFQVFRNSHQIKQFYNGERSVREISPNNPNASRNRWNTKIFPRRIENIDVENLNVDHVEADSGVIHFRQQHPTYFDPATYLYPERLENCGILAETDYCKFVGRGLNQITWRYNYVNKILKKFLTEKKVEPAEPAELYEWPNDDINSIKTRWLGLCANPNHISDDEYDDIATSSSFDEWQRLYFNGGNDDHTNYDFVCRVLHWFYGPYLSGLNNPQLIARLLDRTSEPGTIWGLGRVTGSSDEYATKFLQRVKQQMKALQTEWLNNPNPGNH